MTKTWNEFIEKVNVISKKMEDNGADIIFYRGHSDHTWTLFPSILREKEIKGTVLFN